MFDLKADAKKWQERWVMVERKGGLQRGAQAEVGLVKRVKRVEGDQSRIYFLKYLNSSKNKDKIARKRMFKEVLSYEDLNLQGIPELIESNAHLYDDDAVELYLVTEYIEGTNLTKAPNTIEALNCMEKLCNIVSYIHEKEVWHRDIKPNNIILKDAQWSDPYLVDFGIAHIEAVQKDNISLPQRIGNIFLSLPEYNFGCNFKNDSRSDLTLLIGIFFFLLTGVEPRMLLDHDGNMPHQIHKEILLKKHGIRLKEQALMRFFDRGFSHIIDQRFQTTDQILQEIRCMDKEQTSLNEDNVSKKSIEITEVINNSNRLNVKKTMTKLEEIHSLVKRTMGMVSFTVLKNQFDVQQTNYLKIPGNLEIINTLIFVDIINPGSNQGTSYRSYIKGSEMLLEANGTILYRFDVKDEVLMHENNLMREIEKYMVDRIHELLNK